MAKKALFKWFLFVSILFVLGGSLLKMNHMEGGNLILSIGYVLSIGYIFIGLTQSYQDQGMKTSEKALWLLGFLLVPPLAGLAYYYMVLNRRR